MDGSFCLLPLPASLGLGGSDRDGAVPVLWSVDSGKSLLAGTDRPTD